MPNKAKAIITAADPISLALLESSGEFVMFQTDTVDGGFYGGVDSVR
jgi:hypothetical protein